MRGTLLFGPVTVAWIAGCYAPDVGTGSPCGPGQPCPSELTCSAATGTCESADDVPAGSDWLDGYAYRKRITITPTAAASLAEFPISVVETADASLAAHARADGQDLAFTAADGSTLLAREIVQYDAQTGALDAWFQAPALGAAPTTFYLYYGGASRAGATPWTSLYAGVWHMGGSPATIPDSTARHHDASASEVSRQPGLEPGLVGLARRFDGVDDSTSASNSADFDFGSGSFSYSVWVYVTHSSGAYDMPLFKGGSSPGFPGYDVELGSATWGTGVSDGATSLSTWFGNEPSLLSRWVQLVGVVDRTAGQWSTYVDGVRKASSTISTFGSIDSSLALKIGNDSNPFNGVLDEVRVYTAALSDGWIAAEHANLADRPRFVTLGSAEAR
jgi:hypothetical protein